MKQIVARNTIDTSTERNGEDLSSLPYFFLSIPSLLFIHYLYHELAHIFLTKQFDYYSFSPIKIGKRVSKIYENELKHVFLLFSVSTTATRSGKVFKTPWKNKTAKIYAG